MFAAPPGLQPQTGDDVVQQGYREGSNVQVVNEMVSMIAGMRQYEAAHAPFMLCPTPCKSTVKSKTPEPTNRMTDT